MANEEMEGWSVERVKEFVAEEFSSDIAWKFKCNFIARKLYKSKALQAPYLRYSACGQIQCPAVSGTVPGNCLSL